MATLTPQEYSRSVDWQTTKQTVRDRTTFLFNSSLMSDIKFVVTDSQHESDGTQVRVPAHKLVLAISSPVFEAMFYGDLAEKREEIELPDTEAICLLEFLRFIYCDEVNLSSDNVLGVLYVAKKYIVPTLAAKCRLFLEENTDETNVCQILEEAKRLDESELEEQCWEIIDGDTSTCLESDRILTLTHDTLVSLVQRDSLSAKEIDLFEAVKRWAEAKCEGKSFEKRGGAIRELLGIALDFIRFPTMSQKEFARKVVPTGILTSNEALQVHQSFLEAIPTANMKFPCAIREGMYSMSPLNRCDRYNDHNTYQSVEHYDQLAQNLTFKTDKDILFRGIRVYFGKEKGQQVHVTIRILSEGKETQLTAVEKQLKVRCTSGSPSKYRWGFDVLFDFPIQVRACSKYVIHSVTRCVGGSNMHYNNRFPLTNVNTAGVNFTFEESSENSGQILELLFHTMNY